MKKHPVASIVNFCSNESRFIKPCLEQVQLFSEQVIVPVCNHFFDGTPENRALLNEIYASFPGCLFIEYPYHFKIPKRVWKTIDPAQFWHSLSRLIGFSFLKEEIETVLFLDADEIADGARFNEWLDCSDYQCHTALKMANYWYFREPRYQALHWEDSIVLAQKRSLNPELILRKEERDAIYDLLPGPKRRHVIGVDGEPMFHHYSWVRTQEEMLKKVQTWSHRNDRNWTELVHKEFAGPFQGTDFIHGYKYKTVESPFPILLEPPRFQSHGKSEVIRLSEKDVQKLIKFIKHPFLEWVSETFL